MKARTPFEELASVMAAHKNPLAQAMDAIDPVHLRALRQHQEELYGPTKATSAIADALKSVTAAEAVFGYKPGGAVMSAAADIDRATLTILDDPALYRSPARDVLDQMGMHRDIKPANRGRPVSAPPSPTFPAGGAGETIPITSISDIGRRVREARLGMGMTQQRFADLAGVGRRFLIELEQGKASLEIGRVLAVCQAAGIRLGFVA